MMKTLVLLGVAAAMAAVAVPASATTVLFAQYKQLPNSANTVRWVKSGATGTLSNIPTNGNPWTLVNFNFASTLLATSLGDVTARMTLSAASAGNAQTTVIIPGPGGLSIVTQAVSGGTFSFSTSQDVTLGNTFYAAGSNLLSGSFSGVISGFAGQSGSLASLSVSSFTSDFVSFTPGSTFDFSIALSNVTGGGLGHAPNSVLNGFTTPTTGSFNSDPGPTANAIPEPEVWGLMVIGFGLVGVQTRRRSRRLTVTA
jgi:hypothetical protein